MIGYIVGGIIGAIGGGMLGFCLCALLVSGKDEKQSELTPCDVCRFNPPSSGDGKPCAVCPAQEK